MTELQKDIIGKVSNIIEDRRSAYLAGMIDYMALTGSTAECDFVIGLLDYLNERNYKAETIAEYCEKQDKTKTKKAKEEYDAAYMGWYYGGQHEADEDLNGAAIKLIEAAKAENPLMMGYKFNGGIVQIEGRIYTAFCDAIFEGTLENIKKIKDGEKTKKNMLDVLDDVKAFYIIWS